MGRRSDHTRDELEQLIVGAGHTLLAEVGYQRFSAREVAKRIGYSPANPDKEPLQWRPRTQPSPNW